MTTTASPVSKQTASAAQETGATGAAATAIETIETGVAGVADAATNAAANAIEDLEAAESRGFSTRFPLNSAFIFTFGALGGMLFGFDTGIISGAPRLSIRLRPERLPDRLHHLLGADRLVRRRVVDRRAV